MKTITLQNNNKINLKTIEFWHNSNCPSLLTESLIICAMYDVYSRRVVIIRMAEERMLLKGRLGALEQKRGTNFSSIYEVLTLGSGGVGKLGLRAEIKSK